MFTQDFLKQIEESVFQPYFMEGIRSFHEDAVKGGQFKREVLDYERSLAVLIPTLNDKEKKMLQEYEGVCETIQSYYARHAFIAGIYAGFKQIFTSECALDAGFDQYVTGEIDRQPQMQKYREIYTAKKEQNRIYDLLAKGRSDSCDSPIVCISCYWDEMILSTGAAAFYCGYRTASAITDRFGLMETDYLNRLVKQLALEYSFGYIESYAEKEQRLKRQPDRTGKLGEDEDIAQPDSEE